MSASAVSLADAGGDPPVSSTRASSRGQKDYDRPRVKRATHRPERELRPGRIAASAAQAGNGPLPIEERAATSSKLAHIAISAKDSQASAKDSLLECFPGGRSTSVWTRTHRDAHSSPAPAVFAPVILSAFAPTEPGV